MRRHRWQGSRLLQDHAGLELSIRGLQDTVQALPVPSASVAGGVPCSEAAAAPSVPGRSLRYGDLPNSWLTEVSSLTSLTDALKQQCTMAGLFHNAFVEDLMLWVEGEDLLPVNFLVRQQRALPGSWSGRPRSRGCTRCCTSSCSPASTEAAGTATGRSVRTPA